MVFSIRYGEGFSRGYYAKDTVTINGVSVPQVVSGLSAKRYTNTLTCIYDSQNFAVSDYNDGDLTMDGAGKCLVLHVGAASDMASHRWYLCTGA